MTGEGRARVVVRQAAQFDVEKHRHVGVNGRARGAPRVSGIVVQAIGKIEREMAAQIAFERAGAPVKEMRDAGVGNISEIVKAEPAAQAKAHRLAQVQVRAVQEIAHRGRAAVVAARVVKAGDEFHTVILLGNGGEARGSARETRRQGEGG